MATRQQKIGFAIKRFKGFWNTFKKSKRGLLGIAIIALFAVTALFAPLIAQYDPIQPEYGVGHYPKFGPAMGLTIAAQLCQPVWYKYLPFITRGQSQLTEHFYSLVRSYWTGSSSITIQTFGVQGAANASDVGLLLGHRVSFINTVKANPNGTTVVLDTTKWYINVSQPRIVKLVDYYPNNTAFQVTYTTGVDLIENMKVVKDHEFTVPESINVWNFQTNDTSALQISYNAQKGFTFSPSDTERGCVQISYNPGLSSQTGPIELTMFTNFSYPYDEPPVRFQTYASILSEGSIAPIVVKFAFYRENVTNPFVCAVYDNPSNSSYVHYEVLSYDPQTGKTVGVEPAEDGIFTTHGNYKYAVQLIIPREGQNINIYLDYVDCLIYGNVFGLLGTDNNKPFARDIFSTLVWGSRVSLIVGILSAIFSTLIGLFLGLLSGYIGGILDEGIMRFADLLLVLPTLPLFIVLIVTLKRVSGFVSMWNIIIILTLLGWMGFARSVRSMVLSIRERSFIEAAKAAGAGKLHIVNRHIVPNVFALVYITLATAVPGAIITEASLSWLGLGDPQLASWGKVLYDFNVSGIATTKGLTDYWFWIFPACIAIALLATAFILVGYALDEILNPRLRERR